METVTYALKTNRISKHFDGVYAVRNVSVDLFPGQINGVIGPNGSGKTTFINLITGRFFTDGGSIAFANSSKEVRHLKTHKAASFGITRTFQGINLFDQMSVEGNLFNVLTPRNPLLALFSRRGEAKKKKVYDLLEFLGIPEKRHELAGNLSYGQRKLLEIGRALLMDADIYCFDEPFAGLFPAMIEKVREVFERLKQQGKCILWVEHNINLIKEMSDRVIFMDEGQLLCEGTAEEVFKRPEVLAAYLGA